MVWYSYLFKRVPEFVMRHTVKGFSVVDETEIDVFLEFPCFLYDLANVGNFFSNSSFFFKPSLDIWRRKWQPTPVLLPGESHGGRSLVAYSPWGRKESDTTERLHFRHLEVLGSCNPVA